MHVFPVETSRLRMRALEANDEPLFARLYTDEETMRFIGRPLTLDQARRSFRSAMAGMRRIPIRALFLAVVEKATETTVGICSLQNFDAKRRSVQAGVMFLSQARSQGFSKESFIGLISRTFAELDVDELWVEFATGHIAVERAATRVGFTRRDAASLERAIEAGHATHIWSVRRERWFA